MSVLVSGSVVAPTHSEPTSPFVGSALTAGVTKVLLIGPYTNLGAVDQAVSGVDIVDVVGVTVNSAGWSSGDGTDITDSTVIAVGADASLSINVTALDDVTEYSFTINDLIWEDVTPTS